MLGGFFRIEINGGQGRSGISGKKDIVAANDGHIIGKPQPGFVKLLDCAYGDQIVKTEQRRGAAAGRQGREHLQDSQRAGIRVIPSSQKIVWGIVQAAKGQRIQKRFSAESGGGGQGRTS